MFHQRVQREHAKNTSFFLGAAVGVDVQVVSLELNDLFIWILATRAWCHFS